MGKFLGVRNPKITLRRLKGKPVLRYLRFQVLGTCDWTSDKKYVAGQITEKIVLFLL